MYNLISNINFNNHVDSFQKKKPVNDVKVINSSDGVVMLDDQLNNMYVVPNKLTTRWLMTVSQQRKKAAASTKNEINLEGSKITKKLELAHRMEDFADKRAFHTLKDHKAIVDTKPTCRFIKPTKSEMGVISKHIPKINTQIH